MALQQVMWQKHVPNCGGGSPTTSGSDSWGLEIPGKAQADLKRWHELEEADNQLFGRMHCLWLQRIELSEVPTAAELAAAAAAASLGSYVVGDEETPQGNEPLLTIKVVTPAGNEIFFGCKKTTPLSKLMNLYCQQLGVTLDETRFLFDGDTCIQLAVFGVEELDLAQRHLLMVPRPREDEAV